MKGEKDLTSKRTYLLLQTILCILLGAVLIILAVGIYREGLVRKAEDPLAWIYSMEIVRERFAPVAPLFFVSIGVGLAGIILNVKDDQDGKPVKDAEINRNLIVSRVMEPNETMKKERALQKKLCRGGWAGFAVCLIPIALYMSDGSHFPNGDLEPVIAGVALHVLPWVVLAVACLMVSTVLQEKSMIRETEAAQARRREEKETGGQAEPKPIPASGKSGLLQIALIAAAIVFIVMGIFNGGARDVLYKAAKICTECIGLG